MLCGRISQRVEQLDVELATAEATSAAWRDLVSSAEKVKRKVEEVSFRRDTLYAIAKHRNLDVTGSFGVFATVSSVLTDVADTVLEEEERAAGVDHEPVDPPASWEPSGVQTWRRLHICEQVLAREPYRTLHRLAPSCSGPAANAADSDLARSPRRRDRTDTAAFCLQCSPQAPQRKNTLINESDREEVVNNLEDNAFDDLPLLLAVPRAAALLGISRAATYRLVASGELPVRRLGGRVYVVTAGLRELVAS
jgi:excisionase family DNA binding protein